MVQDSFRHKGLRFIAIIKLLKATGFIVAGFGLLHFLHKDIDDQIQYYLRFYLHVGPEQPLVQWLLQQASIMDDKRIIYFSITSFIAAVLLVIEGIGLYCEKRWAEWMTVILTSSFIPVELYRMVQNITYVRSLVLLLNLSIVAYLVWVIRQGPKETH